MVSWPERGPVAVGVKTMPIEHCALMASVPVQELEAMAKSPAMAGVPKMTAALPVLVRVRVCAVDCVETCCALKVSELVESESAG